MSVKVMTWVFEHSEATLADRLVLLALADFAHDDGTEAFPTLARLAAKARVDERTARRALRALEAAGEIKQTGITAANVRVYQIAMKPDNLSSPPRGGNLSMKGGQSTPGGGQSGQRTNKQPSVNRQRNHQRRNSASPDPDEAPLSHLLADLLAANDPNGKRPKVTGAWAAAEDRMLRLDERSPEEAKRLLEATMRDEFWAGNIRSMPKFREKYGQLHAAAARAGSKASKGMDNAHRMARRAEQTRREEQETA